MRHCRSGASHRSGCGEDGSTKLTNTLSKVAIDWQISKCLHRWLDFVLAALMQQSRAVDGWCRVCAAAENGNGRSLDSLSSRRPAKGSNISILRGFYFTGLNRNRM